MNERLVFGYGTSGHGGEAPARAAAPSPGAAKTESSSSSPSSTLAQLFARRERADWAFNGLLAFTAILFFRPQEQFPPLNPLHLAEVSALLALAAMVMGRLQRGLSVTRYTPELGGVLGLGFIILATAPFSIWMGGSVATFTEMYSKIILIFILMLNTLTNPKRIDRFIWLIVVASGYIAFRALADYARGVNMVENGRVQGAVGGMFKNPNDLALNMVALMPLATALAMRAATTLRRVAAIGCALLMMGAVVVSQSRSGTIGLGVMILILGAGIARRRPAIAAAGVLALMFALPLMPSSYWHRLSSITDQSADETGSREARRILLRESFQAFLEHPITGVGAGQFKNYNPEGRQEAWRESHNVVLQVAAELGIVGLATFGFLVVRAATSGSRTRRLLKRARGQAARRDNSVSADAVITPEEAEWLRSHTTAMTAALAGWFFCALFASVAYNWTFYYLLALAIAPGEFLVDRLGSARKRSSPQRTVELQAVRAW
jgi:Lipid A core - O-antigen ligase and related enzymes